MADPILESLSKNQIKYYVLGHFLSLNKKVEKFQLCLKTAASLFPFSCVTFLISNINYTNIYNKTSRN